jgi:hypothetical protein
MKKLALFAFSAALVMACNKKETSSETPSDFLSVEEKNMGVRGVMTATWCAPCGGQLNGTHDNFVGDLSFGAAAPMAFKDAFSGEFGPHSDWGNYLFDKVGPQFDLGNSVPASFQNFSENTIGEHVGAPFVALNGNYNIDFNGTEMIIKTTTEFFTDYTGDLYLAPFVIVDGLVGYQNGHPDSPETVHRYYVADVAYPTSLTEEDKFEWGYRIAAGDVRKGQKINMEFTLNKKGHWPNNKISIAMVYFRKVGNEYRFVNAYTKQ